MKFFGKFQFYKWMKVTYFMLNEVLIRKVQWKSGCDHYLWSYKFFYLPNLPSKMGLKKCFLSQQLGCRYGPTAIVTSLKIT